MIPDLNKIKAFWHEVSDTIDHLLSETDENDARGLITRYEERLKRIDENLTFHFERDEGDERVEMIFGCDGYAQSIASVLSLVDAAPMINGLRVVAFNGRYDPVPTEIRVGDVNYRVDDFWFSQRTDEGQVHLSLFIDEVDDLESNPQIEAAMIFLDAIIGEFDLMTRVATLSWYEIPDDPLDHGLLPLSSLRSDFDAVRDNIRLIGMTLH
jgi:hypothetical protein